MAAKLQRGSRAAQLNSGVRGQAQFMDWRHVLFAVEQGTIGLLALTVSFPAFALAASPGRRLRASAPSLAATLVFFASCLMAGVSGIEASQIAEFLPLAGFGVAVVLVAPSTLALRWRWLGLLHLLTAAAVAYLWFVATLAISHDAT